MNCRKKMPALVYLYHFFLSSSTSIAYQVTPHHMHTLHTHRSSQYCTVALPKDSSLEERTHSLSTAADEPISDSPSTMTTSDRCQWVPSNHPLLLSHCRLLNLDNYGVTNIKTAPVCLIIPIGQTTTLTLYLLTRWLLILKFTYSLI